MSMSPLKQPFHILRKDAMHIWPETLLSLALLLALAWAIPHSWASDANVPLLTVGFYALDVLIIISWLILASRLVHDEELVGDRQFWTTRPYTWHSLLISKILYLLLFIGVPLIVMQAWLLHHANLYPTAVIPGLLESFLKLGTIFLLPLMAIAAVTGTFIRYICSALGALIYMFAIMVFGLSVLGASFWLDTFGAPGLIYVLAATFIVLPIAAIFVQYAFRKTLIARILLVATPLVFLLAAVITPRNALSAHRYPDTTVGKAAFAPDLLPPPLTTAIDVSKHKVTLFIPVTATSDNLSDKAFIDVQRYQLTLNGPDDVHYTSDWDVTESRLVSGQSGSVIPVTLPEDIFNKIHLKPVALHLTLGSQVFNLGTPYIVTATEKPFPIPSHGTCMASNETGSLDCRFPFGNPTPIAVNAIVHDGDCNAPGPRSGPAEGVVPPAILPFGFNPVDADKVQLAVGERKFFLCPGTSTTFKMADPGNYGRVHLDIPSITLDPFALRVSPKRVQQPAPSEQQ